MVKSINDLKEGDVLNGIMYRRVMIQNKNFIKISVGATGSGKSYSDLRQAELWYRNHLKKEFPIQNVCFKPEEMFARLNSGLLTRGEILIYEEAGTTMGSLDFQSKISKIVNYVLQSFRSLNLILFINLPYATMLNKTTRTLAHFQTEMAGINKEMKQVYVKPFWLQVAQQSGKVYKHYPSVIIAGSMEKIQLMHFNLPSERLRFQYEEKKDRYVKELISGGLEQIENHKKKQLTEQQHEILRLWEQGIFNQPQLATILGKTQSTISSNIASMRRKGWESEVYRQKFKVSDLPKLNTEVLAERFNQKQEVTGNA